MRCVTLVTREKEGGREMGKRPLPHDVNGASPEIPYLGDADFGEFELFTSTAQPVAQPVMLSVRMELHSSGPRSPFGEARVFTVKAQ
jgi:hypothetical protein